MMAEYERAKIVERHRHGKLHAARAGVVNVLGGAPYGYRSIDRHAGGGQARYEMVPAEARVVCRVFDWVGRDRLTIGEVCRRLTQAGEVTRTGKTVWDCSAEIDHYLQQADAEFDALRHTTRHADPQFYAKLPYSLRGGFR